MESKFTIKIDSKILEHAKIYARENNISISRLIEDYLQFLTSTYKTDSYEITPLVKVFQVCSAFQKKKNLKLLTKITSAKSILIEMARLFVGNDVCLHL